MRILRNVFVFRNVLGLLTLTVLGGCFVTKEQVEEMIAISAESVRTDLINKAELGAAIKYARESLDDEDATLRLEIAKLVLKTDFDSLKGDIGQARHLAEANKSELGVVIADIVNISGEQNGLQRKQKELKTQLDAALTKLTETERKLTIALEAVDTMEADKIIELETLVDALSGFGESLRTGLRDLARDSNKVIKNLQKTIDSGKDPSSKAN